ncbi:ankyrin repeat-containing domain protein, partial [Leptodontidium sp. 2 PMI_412]
EDLNKDGFTPLALAVRCKNFRATKMLLDAGANLHQTLTRGQTVMHLAACLGNVNAVELLLQRSPYWVIEDDSGMTPEETALACGHDNIASII